MLRFCAIIAVLLAACLSSAGPLWAQHLFSSDEVLRLRVVTSVRKLMADTKEESEYYTATIDAPRIQGGGAITLPVRIRTRGHFRREYPGCQFPPLMLNFSKSKELGETIFQKQNKIKVVLPCLDKDLVVREYLCYKLYNLVTPVSVRARLAEITFCEAADTTKKQQALCILLEDEDLLAERIGLTKAKPKPELVNDFTLRSDVYLPMTVFQLMIGNTDWSAPYRHNIALFTPPDDTLRFAPVPYDFDFSGLVNAPYANAHEELEMESVRERRYRGYCLPELDSLSPVISKFLNIRSQAIDLAKNNHLLSNAGRRYGVSYIEEFYAILDSEKRRREIFIYPCDPTRPGNVIIKGYPKAVKQ